jgi:hypothetical protein
MTRLTRADAARAVLRRSGRTRALLLIGGIAAVQVGVGASLVAGSGSPNPDLTLASDADGSALVTAAGLAPGHPITRCLRLDYDHAVDDDRIRLMTSPSGGLADHLSVLVESGTGGNSNDCSGFTGNVVYSGTLTALGQQHGTAQTALALRTLTAGTGSVSVRLRFSVNDTNAAQGLGTSADLVWIAEAVGDRTPPPPVIVPVDPPTQPTQPLDPPVPTAPAPAPAPAPTSGTGNEPVVPPPAAPTSRPTSPTAPDRTVTPPSPPAPASTPTASRPTDPDGVPATPSAAPVPADGNGTSGTPPSPHNGNDTRSAAGQIAHVFASGATAIGSAATGLARTLQQQVFRPVAAAAAPAARGAGYGLGGTAPLLGCFLLIQGRIDRRDPKLALAPTYATPDLTFDAVPRGPLQSRGPTS